MTYRAQIAVIENTQHVQQCNLHEQTFNPKEKPTLHKPEASR
jgi:hypothetical protein